MILTSDNFHEVSPGKVYRSGQMDESHLRQTIQRYQIKSILNLRGSNPNQAWYRDECLVAGLSGVHHYDIPLCSDQHVSVSEMNEIVAVMTNAPAPLLIHCWSGSDRTGLASALYKFKAMGCDARSAAQELTVWYGHFPIRGREAMDTSFERFVSNDLAQAHGLGVRIGGK